VKFVKVGFKDILTVQAWAHGIYHIRVYIQLYGQGNSDTYPITTHRQFTIYITIRVRRERLNRRRVTSKRIIQLVIMVIYIYIYIDVCM